jgi:hypothetical protein
LDLLGKNRISLYGMNPFPYLSDFGPWTQSFSGWMAKNF